MVAAQWYVGDELKLKRTTEVFTFTPEDFGVYIIKAEVGDKTLTKNYILQSVFFGYARSFRRRSKRNQRAVFELRV